jgi:hypothetical protein
VTKADPPAPARARQLIVAVAVGVAVLGGPGAGRRAHAAPPAAPGAPATRPLPATAAVDFVADLVARTFIRACFDGTPAELQPLVAEKVSFDGVVLGGAAAQQRLAEVSRRARLHARPKRVVLLPYAAVKAHFGEAPARLRALGLQGAVIALARLDRGGLVVILKQVGGRWKVVALSD